MFPEEEEITTPPPAVAEPNTENLNWKILFHNVSQITYSLCDDYQDRHNH